LSGYIKSLQKKTNEHSPAVYNIYFHALITPLYPSNVYLYRSSSYGPSLISVIVQRRFFLLLFGGSLGLEVVTLVKLGVDALLLLWVRTTWCHFLKSWLSAGRLMTMSEKFISMILINDFRSWLVDCLSEKKRKKKNSIIRTHIFPKESTYPK